MVKISKAFVCSCGQTNRFEFDTNYSIQSITLEVRCSTCGKERVISLEGFGETSVTSPQPGPDIGAMIERPAEVGAQQVGEEEVSYEEQEAFSNLFGRL